VLELFGDKLLKVGAGSGNIVAIANGCVSFWLKAEEVAFENATRAASEDACSSNSSETHP